MRSIVLGLAIMGLGLNPCAANAALMMLQVTGNVNTGFGTTAAESDFLGEITFDDAQTPTQIGPTDASYTYSARITIGSETVTILSGEFHVYNNHNSVDQVKFSNGPFVMGGVPFAHGYFEFIGKDTTVLSSTNLPFSTNLSDYRKATYTAIAGETAQIGVTIKTMQVLPVAAAVPEPATLAMWGLGAFGLGLTRRLRRKQAAVAA